MVHLVLAALKILLLPSSKEVILLRRHWGLRAAGVGRRHTVLEVLVCYPGRAQIRVDKSAAILIVRSIIDDVSIQVDLR